LGVTNGTIFDPQNVIFFLMPDVVLGGGEAMRRREFITFVGSSAAAWPLAARAQQPSRLRQVAILRSEVAGDPEGLRNSAALVQGLQALGWTQGRNVQIEQRWAGGSVDAMRALARELVALEPNVIVVISTPVTMAVMQETHTIPIIFVQNFDPVESGLVKSLVAPGGNITGFTSYEPAMASKWLELLKGVAPQVARVAVIYNPQTAPYGGSFLRSVETAGPAFAIQATAMPIQDAGTIEKAIEAFARETNPSLMVLPDVTATVHEKLIVKLAAQHRLPAIYPWRHFVTAGGLMCYAADLPNLWRRAASYVDRVLKGEKPAGLPVQQPTKFELVINLTAAKAVGLTIPASILSLADDLIE
jgi:putative ABC transport system substrate-binding protein